MGTLPSLLRRFYFIFKEQRDKSKKDSPSSPPPPPPRHFKPDWFPFPFLGSPPQPPLHSSLLASIFSSLFFHARIILCGGNVSTVCSRVGAEMWRDVMRQSASSKFNYIVPHLTSQYSVLNIEHEFKIHSAGTSGRLVHGRNITLLMRVGLLKRVFSPVYSSTEHVG